MASAGFSLDASGVSQHAVVTRVGGLATRTIQEAKQAFLAKADGEAVVVK